MPAKGYQFYRIIEFPSWELGKSFETQHQETLFNDVDETPKTVVTYVGLADNANFKKYHVLHETYQKIRGRYQSKPINGYIAQVEFHLYNNPTEGVLLIDTQRTLCREMVNRLENSNTEFLVQPEEIDLIKLGGDLRERIRGGWFGDLKIADVSTIGMFGSTVGESDEWQRFEQMGRLNAIDLDLELSGMELLVKIMSNRGIVVFENLSESLSLKTLLGIQKELNKYKTEKK
jgi:hypothetical protein